MNTQIKLTLNIVSNKTELNIWTYNINAIKNKMGLITDLLIKHNIDILIITETKIREHIEPTLIFSYNYSVIWNSNKLTSFHGVAIVYRKGILNVTLLSNILTHSLQFQDIKLDSKDIDANKVNNVSSDSIVQDINKAHYHEGRILTVLCKFKEQSFVIVGTYVPNSGVNRNDPLKRLAYRTLSWDRDLFIHLETLRLQYKDIIWLGDLNVCAKDNDMPNKHYYIAGTTNTERTNFAWYQTNWIDTWEYCNPDETNCSQRATYGIGSPCLLRLDYIMCSKSMQDKISSSIIDQEFYGSDHVPIGTKFKID